ncbi:MAG: biotin/lipoyl-binding protein [Deltaproteobacteria bacterium]|nr:biotin/lipoyl-binding protein [Deltaproteobacteria bacterium]
MSNNQASPSIDYRVLGPGHYSLLVDGKSYEVFVRKEKQGFVVEIDGWVDHPYLIPVGSERANGESSSQAASGNEVVVSPMPGRVIGIKVQVGQAVKPGDSLVVVEAMKMENELQTSVSGTVKEILVKQGQTVEAGQGLVVIE